MRQKILKIGSTLYDVIKSPVGLTITGGIAVSTTTYLLGQTKVIHDLEQSQLDNQQLKERVLKLENENSDLSKQNRDLFFVNQDYSNKSNELRSELQHTQTRLNSTWFFCKNYAANAQEIQTNIDKDSKIVSFSKK